MPVELRTATEEDVRALAELRLRWTLEEHPDQPAQRRPFEAAFSAVVGAGIASGRWTVWIAESEGEIIAHVFVGLIDKVPRPTREDRWIGYVTNVYTRPEHRGQGTGTMLLERVKAWAEEQQIELLFVWPSDESVRFYERAGFASGRDPLVWERE